MSDRNGFLSWCYLLTFHLRPTSSDPVRDIVEISPINTNPWAAHSPNIHNVPKRSNTHPGHGFSRKPENMIVRTRNQITKKLADVSFSWLYLHFDMYFIADGFHGEFTSAATREDFALAYRWTHFTRTGG